MSGRCVASTLLSGLTTLMYAWAGGACSARIRRFRISSVPRSEYWVRTELLGSCRSQKPVSAKIHDYNLLALTMYAGFVIAVPRFL